MGHNSQGYLSCWQLEWNLWVSGTHMPVVLATGPNEEVSSTIWLPADTELNLDSKHRGFSSVIKAFWLG